MQINWTKPQADAVYAPVSNLLVTAAAGSGKTQVLTGRIIERLTQGAEITRLLIVTFTAAAAAEMRERIGKSLADRLKAEPENRHIRRQLLLLNTAKIDTIHSFCLDVVRSNFSAAGLDADFKIADEAEAALLRLEAADTALEELYGEADGDFLLFADSFSAPRSDRFLAESVISTCLFADSMPRPLEWLKSQLENYNIESGAEEFCKGPVAREIISAAKKHLFQAKDYLKTAKAMCNAGNGLQKFVPMFEGDINCVNRVIEASDDWDLMHHALNGFSFDRQVIVKGADQQSKEEAVSLRKLARGEVDRAAEYIFCTSAEAVKTQKSAYPLVRGFYLLAERYIKIYSELKRERGLLDFADIEHICIDLLEDRSHGDSRPSAIAKEIMERFDEIYIDEYQDTGITQELIFKLISKENEGRPNIFMVGDIKQSIYGFRQTKPQLFLDKKLSYGTGEGASHRKIQLSSNFRSRPEVIGFINHVFSLMMRGERAGFTYDEDEALYPAAEYPPSDGSHSTEINIIDRASESDLEDDLEKTELEARLIAKKIHELMSGFTVYDLKTKNQRPIKYSDIAIIMRSVKNTAPVIEAELAAAGVPVYADIGTGYFDTPEIRLMLSLLSVIDNPANDIPLIAVLRSPLFAFSEDELARIRQARRDTLYWNALASCAEGEGALAQKCKAFIKRLKSWRRRALCSPTDELIHYLMNDSGIMDFISALPDSQMRSANLKLLFEKARQFEKTSFKGLFSFIRFIEGVKSRSDSSGAKLIGENHDVVRIMSIHKSKGLEFPVVILANTGGKFNRTSSQGRLLLHSDIGLGIEFIDRARGISYPTPSKTAAAIRIREEDIEEEMRILYVAMTRAKEKLIITATVKDAEKSLSKWRSMAAIQSPSVFAGALYPIDQICACALTASCKSLRDLADFSAPVKNPAQVDFKLYSKNQAAEGFCPETNKEDTATEECGGRIKQLLSYEYPYSALLKIPSKVTVTELKRLRNQEFDEEAVPLIKSPNIKTPRFLQEKGQLTSAQRGSLIHLVMQSIDFHSVSTLSDVKNHIDGLVSKKVITPEQALAIPCEKISTFLNSPLGLRIKNADRVFKEAPFTMPMPASAISKDSAHFGETVLVQGIIDCFFFEGDNIILVDYKTDRVKDKEYIKELYAPQIDIYSLALEKKFFSKIYEKFIYLFDINDIILYN